MTETVRSQTGGFSLAAPLAKVTPLFTAEGERLWAKGWEPEILSGDGERGSAFRTRDGKGRVTTWIVTRHDPARGRVSYARLVQESNIGLVDVSLTDAGGGTRVTVTYTLTALNPEGARFVANFLEPARYARMMQEWEEATAAAIGVNCRQD